MMDDGTAHAFGRVEGKLDRMFDELSTHGRELAELRVRVGHVEDDVVELKTARNADQRHGITLRGSILVGLTTVVTSGGLTALMSALIR